MQLTEIEKPTVFLNETITKRNIARMAEKARQSNVRFRPHFKTHQSAGVGDWFRAEGVTAITASSVDMAEYFANAGWQDITIAFPVNWRQINKINELASRVELNLLVESVETVEFLRDHLTSPVKVWLKIDTGYHRTGIEWDDAATLQAVAIAITESEGLTLRGLLTHSGHTYRARTKAAITDIYNETTVRLGASREQLAAFGDLDISIGDTPSCSVVDDLSAVDEIRPGNFVFYDVMQLNIGSCQWDDIAVGVACPVVAKHPSRGTIITHGGTVHFSSDFIMRNENTRSYGLVSLPTKNGWSAPFDNSYVAGLSQEHGIIHASPALMEQVKLGDVLVMLPIHSCLTVNLYSHYETITDNVGELTIADLL